MPVFPYDDSPANDRIIGRNLEAIRREAVEFGQTRPAVDDFFIRDWHRRALRGVILAHRNVGGHYRGSHPPPLLRDYKVVVGGVRGTPPELVSAGVARFLANLSARVLAIDARVPSALAPRIGSPEEIAIIDLCAWAHGEWIRIHPFANCNGSTARLWGTYLAARYEVPLVLAGKPRPQAFYGQLAYIPAANAQMRGSDLLMKAWLTAVLAATQRQISSSH